MTLSGRMDEALDADPNWKRTLIFLILAGGWWVPDNAYRVWTLDQRHATPG